jgi:hypothetical protein
LAGLAAAATLLGGIGLGSAGSVTAARAATSAPPVVSPASLSPASLSRASGLTIRREIASAEARAGLAVRALPALGAHPAAIVPVGVGGDRISCGSPTACLAVGQSAGPAGSGGPTLPPAVALEGTTWKTIAVPLPKIPQPYLNLDGVSCKTATYCLVVADYADQNGNSHPYILTWNGRWLAATAVPPVPRGDTFGSFSGVSCVAAKSCVVFGSAYDKYGNTVNLTWTWTLSKWAVKAFKFPGNAQDAALTAAHCLSLTSCEVSGSYQTVTINGTSTTYTLYLLLAAWNGSTLTPQQAAIPAGLNDGNITDVSCYSPSSCAATGIGITETGSGAFAGFWGFVEVWNGNTWTATKWTGPAGTDFAFLGGVSCASATSCVAVGGAVNSKAATGSAAALVWNGTNWLVTGVPSAGRGLITGFSDVSCPKARACVAIGEYGSATALVSKTLAGYWNGTRWGLKGA